jgi:hypothetical protein
MGDLMRKSFVFATLFAFVAAAIVAPTSARADRSGAVAAGVIGGLAVGAMLGSAAAANGPYYPYYAPPAAYYGPGSPGCYWQRQRVWDGFQWRRTRIYVCY